jgi:hypothetical protein
MNEFNKYGKTFGKYDGPQASIATIDPELVKSVLVKNFDSFPDATDFPVSTQPFNIILYFMRVLSSNAIQASKGLVTRAISCAISCKSQVQFAANRRSDFMSTVEATADTKSHL